MEEYNKTDKENIKALLKLICEEVNVVCFYSNFKTANGEKIWYHQYLDRFILDYNLCGKIVNKDVANL